MIEIRVDGKLALTTEQVLERADRWRTTGALRSWIARNEIEPAAELNARTKLYYPEDLGLEGVVTGILALNEEIRITKRDGQLYVLRCLDGQPWFEAPIPELREGDTFALKAPKDFRTAIS